MHPEGANDHRENHGAIMLDDVDADAVLLVNRQRSTIAGHELTARACNGCGHEGIIGSAAAYPAFGKSEHEGAVLAGAKL